MALSAVVCALPSFVAGTVVAQPQVPASFYGTVSADGKPVADGASIFAFIDGKDCTQPGARGAIRQGEASVYVLSVMHESQAAGCGLDGKTITFVVGDRPAAQLATWRPGLQHLDLNAGAGEPLPMPPETSSTPNAVDRLATATEQAKFTPKAGAPPTDNVTFDRTPVPGQQAAPTGGSGGGASPLLVLGIGAVVVAALGAAGGLALSRRSGRQSGQRLPPSS
jgi:hypothetical protein